MRPFLMGGVLLAIAGAAQAQGLYIGPGGDPGRIAGLQMQIEQAQRDALASQTQAGALQMQLQTEQRIAGLNAQLGATAVPSTPSPQAAAQESAILQSSIDRARTLDAQGRADADRMSQLTAQALANSNARIMAVKPALR
jgi:hypothetical protein